MAESVDMSQFMDVVTTYKCKVCSFSCEKQGILFGHIRSEHMQSEPPVEELPQEKVSHLQTNSNPDTPDLSVRFHAAPILNDPQEEVEPPLPTDSLQSENQDMPREPQDLPDGSLQGGLQRVAIQTYDSDGHPTEQLVYVDSSTSTLPIPIDADTVTEKEMFLCGNCQRGFPTIDECKDHMIATHNVEIASLPSPSLPAEIPENVVDELIDEVAEGEGHSSENTVADNPTITNSRSEYHQGMPVISLREEQPDGRVNMATQVEKKKPGRKPKVHSTDPSTGVPLQPASPEEQVIRLDGADSDDDLVTTQYVTIELPGSGKRRRRPPKHLAADYLIPKRVKDAVQTQAPVEQLQRKREAKELKEKTYGEFTIKCSRPRCRARFRTEAAHDYHLKTHSASGQVAVTYTCPEVGCGTAFVATVWADFKQHAWRHHKLDLDMIPCDQCNYKASLPSKLIIHKETHSGDRPYSCNICHKGFKQASQLKNHEVMHAVPLDVTEKESMSGRHWFVQTQCEICKRTFANQKSLACHIEAVHDKIKPYKCTYCGHSAARKAMMELHMRTHTGEKPFSCDLCPYQTGDHNSMRRHKMRHTGDKPYRCQHCGYACIQAVSLKLHLKSKHPASDSVFSCHRCTYRTVNKTLYTNHVRDHDMGLIDETASDNPSQSISVVTQSSGAPLRLGQIVDLTGETSHNATSIIVSALNAIAPSLTENGESLPDNIETTIQTVAISGASKSYKIVFQIPATATRSAKAAEVVVQEQASAPVELERLPEPREQSAELETQHVVDIMEPERDESELVTVM